MTRFFLIAVLSLLLGYGLIEAWPLIAGPTLVIETPTDGMPFPNGVVTISGVAARASDLEVNGAPVLHEENGRFVSTLTFPRGGSILTFKATDRFGRRVTTTRSIFVP